jgi:hypothetical protein
VFDEQAHPFGAVHFTAQLMQLSPHAHSGQTMQHPVDPSLQLTRSAVSPAGNNQTANDQSRRYRRATTVLYDQLLGASQYNQPTRVARCSSDMGGAPIGGMGSVQPRSLKRMSIWKLLTSA